MREQMAQEQHNANVDKFDKYSKATADGIAAGVSVVNPVLGGLYWGSTAVYDASKGNYAGAGMRSVGTVLPVVEQYAPSAVPWLNGTIQSVIGGSSVDDMVNNGVNTENAAGLALSLIPMANKRTVQTAKDYVYTPKSLKKYQQVSLSLNDPQEYDAFRYMKRNKDGSLYQDVDGKYQYDTDRLIKDFNAGRQAAVDFFNSDTYKQAQAHNQQLAEKVGINLINSKHSAERAESKAHIKSVINPDSNVAASVTRQAGRGADVSDDKIILDLGWDADTGAFHESLHRGNYGNFPDEYTPENDPSIVNYTDIWKPNTVFWKWKNEKLLIPREKSTNTDLWDYLGEYAQRGEAGTNILEIGRKYGLKPGQPYPGDKAALELFEKISTDPNKGNIFNQYNWREKPKRVWEALVGQYFSYNEVIPKVQYAKRGSKLIKLEKSNY